MIKSNLPGVLKKFKGARAAVPGIVSKNLTPAEWPSMKSLARTAMRAVSTTEAERESIEVIIESFTVQATATTLEFALAGSLMAIIPFEGNIEDVNYQRVLDWVQRGIAGEDGGKLIDERDHYVDGQQMSAQDIAHRVMAAMRQESLPWLRDDEPGHGALNPDGLIQFISRTNLTVGPSSLLKLLLSALFAWRMHLQSRLAPSVGRDIMLFLKKN